MTEVDETPAELPIAVGDRVHVARTISESDVYLYAGITGDVHENHVVRSAANTDDRIAHGTYLLGLMSMASSALHHRHDEVTVSYGYDRVRFVRPVHIGDTITVNYVVSSLDPVGRRSFAEVACVNQHNETVAVAVHIAKYLGARHVADL